MGANRRETRIRIPTRGDLWAPTGAKRGFASPPEWFFGYQSAGNSDSRPHPSGFVGARPARFGLVTPCEGDCGCQGPGNPVSGPDRGDLWAPANSADRHLSPPRLGCACRTPHCALARRVPGLVEPVGQRTVHSAYLPQSSCLADIAPTTARPAGRAGARPDRHCTRLAGPLAPPGCSGRAWCSFVHLSCAIARRKSNPDLCPTTDPIARATRQACRLNRPREPPDRRFRGAARRASGRKSLRSLGFWEAGPPARTAPDADRCSMPSRRALQVAPVLAVISGGQANRGRPTAQSLSAPASEMRFLL